METSPDVEWPATLHSLVAGREAVAGEPYHKKGYSHRSCPDCGQRTLVRMPLPKHFRPCRWVGINVRRYSCDDCGRDSVLRCR